MTPPGTRRSPSPDEEQWHDAPLAVTVFSSEDTGHIAELLERCTFAPATGLDCAVSGGADSMALLVLAVATGADVRVIHVDHGLREGSADEARRVRAAAERFGAGFTSLQLELEPGPNLEARARSLRYAALPEGVLTGHTADDQAETVLLGLMRGSGWQGLGGMTPAPRRPILALRRSETVELCRRLELDPIVDPSNVDPVHRRNRVRHELLPLIADISDRDPVPILNRQAELFRQGADFISAAAGDLDPTDARALAVAPVVLARQAVRSWLWAGMGAEHPPDLATVDRVLDVASLRCLATDVGGKWRVERSGQRLRLVPPAAHKEYPAQP